MLVLRSRSQLIRRCWLQLGAVVVQLEGAGCKCNVNVPMRLGEYNRKHPKRSLVFIVLTAVLIGLAIDVIAEGIENRNGRVLDAQITESQSEMRLVGAEIAQIKDHDFESMAQYIQAYVRIGPLVNDYDQKLQKYSDLYRRAEQRDQHRSVIHFEHAGLRIHAIGGRRARLTRAVARGWAKVVLPKHGAMKS